MISSVISSPIAAMILAARSGRDTNDLVVTVIVILGVVVAAGWIGWHRLQLYRGRGLHHPRKLFVSLCRAHALDRGQQRLLSDLAQSRQLQHPGLIFLQPDFFDITNVGPAFAPHVEALQKLRQQLFATEPLPAKISQSTQIPR